MNTEFVYELDDSGMVLAPGEEVPVFSKEEDEWLFKSADAITEKLKEKYKTK